MRIAWRNELLLLMLLQAGAGPSAAEEQGRALFDPVPGRAGRASSADLNWDHGNTDWRSIPAGEKLVVADIEGPGVIEHIWFTAGLYSGSPPAGWPRELELLFFWDDATTAAVQAPFGDFFAAGNGNVSAYESAMMQVGGQDRRAFNSYWPMPFAERARLEIHNHLPIPIDKFYFQVDYRELDALDPATRYFHAQFHAEDPVPPGRDYVVAEITGTGHYVGTVFTSLNVSGSEFGEADEWFFIDGSPSPVLRGTGSEDYIGQAWGFRNEATDYHGFLGFAGGFTFYRWHVPDPIPFDQSLKLVWENWGGDGQGGFSERTWRFSSVAYWYQLDRPYTMANSSRWGRMD